MNETFTYFNMLHMTSARKRNFERVLAMLIANKDESVWSTAIDSVHEYYKKAKDDEFIKDLLTEYATDLNEKGDDDEQLDKKIKVFVKICQLGISKLNSFIETLLFTSPIRPWQLEAIANTAKIYGSKMYMKGILRTGLMFFIDQYLVQTKTAEKGELLLYTMKQLVENLSEEHEGMFVTQTLDFLKKYALVKEGNLELALLALALLSQYYEYNNPAENQYLGNIVENLIPLMTDDSEGSATIFNALGQFLKVVPAVTADQAVGVDATGVRQLHRDSQVRLDEHFQQEPVSGWPGLACSLRAFLRSGGQLHHCWRPQNLHNRT